MGRWRPPGPAAAPYITAAGYRQLESESLELRTRRREVVRHLAAAAAEGDRSENAEYQYRKKQLRELDRRLGYLERRMPRLRIVRERPADSGQVFFGACVTLEGGDGEVRRFRIVGSDEAEPTTGALSVDSPVARALLGKRLDSELELERLGTMTIIAIDYLEDAADAQ